MVLIKSMNYSGYHYSFILFVYKSFEKNAGFQLMFQGKDKDWSLSIHPR